MSSKSYIIAEEISPAVKQIAAHLRTKYLMNIFCMEYKVLRTEQGEYIVSTERIGGYEDIGIAKPKSNKSIRWSESVKIKALVKDAAFKITGGDYTKTFTASDMYRELIKDYPDINRNTVGCQVIQDCVNHSSRKHYPGGQQDLYYLVSKGVFRLYDSAKDGQWDSKGERVSLKQHIMNITG